MTARPLARFDRSEDITACSVCLKPVRLANLAGSTEKEEFDVDPSPGGAWRVGPMGNGGFVAIASNDAARYDLYTKHASTCSGPAVPPTLSSVPTSVGLLPTVSVELITPEMAAALLETLPTTKAGTRAQRYIRPHKVRDIVKLMREDRWPTGTTTIVISNQGRLLDGSHRLTACVEADVPFFENVARGVDPKHLALIDQGSYRTNADVARMAGIGSQNNQVSQIATVLLQWQYDCLGAPGRITSQYWDAADYAEYIDVHADELVIAAEHAKRLRRAIGLHLGAWGAFVYRAREIDPAITDVFVELLIQGVQLKADDPVYVLREWAVRNNRNRSKGSGAKSQLVACCRAWNYAMNGHPLKHLKAVGFDIPEMVGPTTPATS